MKVKIQNNSIKVFFLATIIMGASLWRIFFFYGAYGEIFFEYIYSITFISTAIFSVYFFIPKALRPFNIFGASLFLVPVIWFLISYANFISDVLWIDFFATGIEYIIVFFSLPYIFYFILSVYQEKTLSLKPRKLLYVLVLLALGIGLVAFLLGKYNYHFMFCRDFEMSGMSLPEVCWSEKDGSLKYKTQTRLN